MKQETFPATVQKVSIEAGFPTDVENKIWWVGGWGMGGGGGLESIHGGSMEGWNGILKI